ncbi:hypothetical protein CU102_20840 [Phyllobacterium brassicacearum]|uniref:Nucleotide-diphospho-sugar transferase domain-containing protein n=1 Tax=Phyllobacterium brassicacearum TaxID=314235 RepID=A0A2P7BEN0_9HYPH|nr:hypothetical protein CU102_20840 [Phyllobacterium brassicacearum]TDQ22959.1 hypothetical protein DEV91_11761 [Phyllobacterium brassicacearum]
MGRSTDSRTESSDLILAACNDAYFYTFAIDLIRSMERIESTHSLHLHLLEPSDAVIQKAEELKRKLIWVKLTYTVDQCALAASVNNRAIYYTSARFLLAPSILARGIDRLLIIDVDAVMNFSPWGLFDRTSLKHSGGFIFRPHMNRPTRKVLASAVFFHSSAGSMRLADTLARSLAVTFKSRPRYHIDQILPHYICTIATSRFWDFSTFDIPAKLMGYSYQADAAFWTTKGKSNIDRFLSERTKLLDSTTH